MKRVNVLRLLIIGFLLYSQFIFSEEFVMEKEKKIVVFETNQGSFEVELYPEIAPKACKNFIELAEKNYYNGTIFHRVIKGFMIQGGDPTATGTGGESIWGKTFEDEFSLTLKFDRPKLLAMANRGPSTNGSQFFITTASAPWLNNKHTIFGAVISNFDIVQKIESSRTDSKDMPFEPQKILRIYVK
jgi:peptidylprolyl isomerase